VIDNNKLRLSYLNGTSMEDAALQMISTLAPYAAIYNAV
jgi:hypothetical protein